MEKVLTTNNGESNWSKLAVFGLHSRRAILGFNSYGGRNGAVLKIDPATGMRVMFYPAIAPRSERAERTIKVPGRRGRPAMFGPIQAKEAGKRGRPAQFGPIMFREPMKRGRKPYTAEQKAAREAIKAELASLTFYNHPMRQRGRKPSVKDTSEPLIAGTQSASNSSKKRGRVSEADRIKAAKKGAVIQVKGGSWLMIADGLASWIAA